MIKLRPDELATLAKYIYDLTTISLDESKSYLIENRLGALAREAGCSSFSEFYRKARGDATGVLKRKIVDAITTNETSFFRDTAPFELLRHKILPDLIDRRTKAQRGGARIPLRIWSAACSTGQEVYSTAIVLKELLIDLDRYDIRLVGTDISDEAIAQASRGVFRKIEIERGLSQNQISRYFTLQGDAWKIADEIRGMAVFRTYNLAQSFAALGRFDIVLCRNVAIYFSEPDRISLYRRVGQVLANDGYLVIGSMETLPSACSQFEPKRYVRSVFYQQKQAGADGAFAAVPRPSPAGAAASRLGSGGLTTPRSPSAAPPSGSPSLDRRFGSLASPRRG